MPPTSCAAPCASCSTSSSRSLPEFTLRSGRRVDLMALARDGRFTAVEIKSCARGLPHRPQVARLSGLRRPLLLRRRARTSRIELLPAEEGLILADRFAAEPGPAGRRAAAGPGPASRRCSCASPGPRRSGCRGGRPRARRRSPARLRPRPATPRSGSGRCCRRPGRRTGRRSGSSLSSRARTSARPRARPGRGAARWSRAGAKAQHQRLRERPGLRAAVGESSTSIAGLLAAPRGRACRSSNSPGSTKPARVEYMPGGEARRAAEQAAVAVGHQHDHGGIGAREVLAAAARAWRDVAALGGPRSRRRRRRRSGAPACQCTMRAHRPGVAASAAGRSRPDAAQLDQLAGRRLRVAERPARTRPPPSRIAQEDARPRAARRPARRRRRMSRGAASSAQRPAP